MHYAVLKGHTLSCQVQIRKQLHELIKVSVRVVIVLAQRSRTNREMEVGAVRVRVARYPAVFPFRLLRIAAWNCKFWHLAFRERVHKGNLVGNEFLMIVEPLCRSFS